MTIEIHEDDYDRYHCHEYYSDSDIGDDDGDDDDDDDNDIDEGS